MCAMEDLDFLDDPRCETDQVIMVATPRGGSVVWICPECGRVSLGV